MFIKIGADELILWLRKNQIGLSIPNGGAGGMGRKIYDIILKLGGRKIEDDIPSYWECEDNSKNIGEYNLPKTSALYEIDVKKLAELYTEINLLKISQTAGL
jgi:hypothetical protein